MNRSNLAIPGRLNLTIAGVQLVALCSILWAAGQVHQWRFVFLLAVAYGIVMNSGYAMLHEAEHNLLHPDPIVNQSAGALLALFFPAPFHLIRQGHIGHHVTFEIARTTRPSISTLRTKTVFGSTCSCTER